MTARFENSSRGREVLGLGCQRAILKPHACSADSQRMFAARHRPLLLVEDRLLALRMSLNAPVLATAELPVGPARAAIVVHAQGASRCFSIVVRSLRNGASVIYELEGEDLREDSGWAVALDASLSFGESMGFLFDDEMLVDRSPETLRRAITRLHEILAPPDVSDDEPLTASAPRVSANEAGEILLEDELDNAAQDGDAQGSDITGPLDAASPRLDRQALRGDPNDATNHAIHARPEDPAGQTLRPLNDDPPTRERHALPVAQPVALSRFRATAPDRTEASESKPNAEPSATPVRGGATLGRVRPVRLRAPDPDAPAKVDPALRLLADF